MDGISILIVSWNSSHYLRRCLDSIRQSRPVGVVEVLVVDNASSDGSPEMVEADFPEVRLIRAGANLGFARGNNLAMRHATGSLWALVNSDALVHPGCLETLARFLAQDPQAGLVGPRVIGGDGRLQRTCRRLPTLWNTTCRTLALDRVLGERPAFAGYEMTAAEHEVCGEVEVLSGCFCVVRRSAVMAVGGLDERFFFYGEDLDWCKRLHDGGWRVVFVPEATATHFGGGSTDNAPLRYSIEILRATLTYWRKHHGAWGRAACLVLLLAHHALRLSLRGLLRGIGLANSPASRHKLVEDAVCLRWLVLGSGAGLIDAPPEGRRT